LTVTDPEILRAHLAETRRARIAESRQLHRLGVLERRWFEE